MNGMTAIESIEELMSWLPKADFAVFAHGLAPHGRDYVLIVQDCLGPNPGTHEIAFSHCVHFDYETRVRDDVWVESWSDEFIDYPAWEAAGGPSGYVWGTNWSNAYPGLTLVRNSELAAEWAERLGKEMFELTLETDRFFIGIVFHSVSSRKVSDDTSTIAAVTIPLSPPEPQPGQEPEG